MISDLSQVRIGRARIGLFAVAFAICVPGMFGEFLWDDLLLIVDNPIVGGAQSSLRALVTPLIESDEDGHVYYRPVATFAFALWARLWGISPLPFHLLSCLLYAAVCVLSLRWLRLRQPAVHEDPSRLSWPILAACLWLVLHPTRAQTVAWASGAFDLWLALFVLLAAIAAERERPRAWHIFATGLCCTLALFSKEAGIVLPVWLAMDCALRHGRQGVRARRFLLAAGFVGTSVGLVVRGAFTIAPSSGPLDAGLPALVSRALTSLGFLCARVVWPFDLTVQKELDLGDPSAMPLSYAGLFLLALAVLGGCAWLAVRSVRRPALRPVVADMVGFLLLVAPTLNVVVIGQQGGSLSERYLFVPLFLAGSLLVRALRRLASRTSSTDDHAEKRDAPTNQALPEPDHSRALALSGAGLALAFTLQFQVEQGRFQNAQTFFDSLLSRDPSSLFAWDYATSLALREQDYPRTLALAESRFEIAFEAPQGLSASFAPRKAPPDPARALAMLRYASTQARLSSDANQERLVELRTACDALLGESGEAQLSTSRGNFALTAPEGLGEGLVELGMREEARLLQATLHARTLDLETAASLIAEGTARGEDPSSRHALRARFALWTSRADEAARYVGTPAAASIAGFDRLVSDLHAALAHDDVAAEARVVAFAGLPARARQRLDTIDASPVARAEIDLFDGRPDLARERLSTAAKSPARDALLLEAEKALQRGRAVRL